MCAPQSLRMHFDEETWFYFQGYTVPKVHDRNDVFNIEERQETFDRGFTIANVMGFYASLLALLFLNCLLCL